MARDGVNQAIGTFAIEFGITRDVLRRILAEAGVQAVGKRSGHPLYRLRDVYGALARQQNQVSMSPYARQALARAIEIEDRIRVRRQELVEVDDVQRQFGLVFQSVARAFDTAVDGLERDLGMSPEQVSFLEQHFDSVRNELADELGDRD